MEGDQREDYLLRAEESYRQSLEETTTTCQSSVISFQLKPSYIYEKDIVWNENRLIGVNTIVFSHFSWYFVGDTQ